MTTTPDKPPRWIPKPMAETPAPRAHPLQELHWVDPQALHANDYNPNRVFPPEMELLKTSIVETGWTQPIVAKPDGEIVDGFHRWTLGLYDVDVRAISSGLVPVVFVDLDPAHQVLATVRHNRARGQHGVLKMATIVQDLLAAGMEPEAIQVRLGMDIEEVTRLADVRASPEVHGKDSFGQGWVPDPEGKAKRAAK